MGAKMEMTGVEQLIASLAALKPTFKANSEPILKKHAEQAAAMIRQVYPSITGGLRAGVKVLEGAPAAARVTERLVSAAPYAHYYEFGTSRSRAFPTFYPIVDRAQAAAVQEIVGMVSNEGLGVKGEPA